MIYPSLFSSSALRHHHEALLLETEIPFRNPKFLFLLLQAVSSQLSRQTSQGARLECLPMNSCQCMHICTPMVRTRPAERYVIRSALTDAPRLSSFVSNNLLPLPNEGLPCPAATDSSVGVCSVLRSSLDPTSKVSPTQRIHRAYGPPYPP